MLKKNQDVAFVNRYLYYIKHLAYVVINGRMSGEPVEQYVSEILALWEKENLDKETDDSW